MSLNSLEINSTSFPSCASILYKKLVNSNLRSQYEHLLKTATTYEEWAEAAVELDRLEGLNEWKEDMASPDYDWELVKARLDQLREIRKLDKGQAAMIFALRTSLSRNLGDMGNSKLYSYARVGTKNLTSEYIEEVVKQLNWICDEPSDPSDGLDLKSKHEFFMNIRQSFGRTALLLSGGGTLGLNHIGVIKCLYERNLLPRIISGASSGSIMASIICTRTEDELPWAFDPTNMSLDCFERTGQPDTPLIRLHRLFTQGHLFDVSILQESLRENFGDYTFLEAFNRTRWILNITVSSSTLYDMPRLLNYLTAPNVLIWSAVAASCAVPVFYGSTPIYAKDKNGKIVHWNPSETHQLYIDGSVENDLPMNKLSELFNVNHFIVCQVNPHVIPFLQKTNAPSKVRQAANFCMHLAKTEIHHRFAQLTELSVMPSFFYKIQSILSQKYSGDITIIPDIGYSDFLKVLSNPTEKLAAYAIQQGERATWPKMSIIKNHLQVELAIDQILYRLRLLRLNEMQRKRPNLEHRSTSHSLLRHDESQKQTEMTDDTRVSQNTPLSNEVLHKRERNSTKRGLMMTKK
ncbi:acyl transferase/acyl hydrolase/lysophospholipase [Sporodiniella umbellata]|nr:acyl transferase/acyl hydrolase/lysophospholipase [Sporodiniella umbellata]